MSEATPEPEADPAPWEIDPAQFGPEDIEGNPPPSRKDSEDETS